MSKYDALRRHLEDLQTDRWRVSFEDLERLLGAPLPSRARKQAAWWTDAEQGHARAWTAGGWATGELDLEGGAVTFFRQPRATATAALERKPLPPKLEAAGERALAAVEARPVAVVTAAALTAFALGVALGYILTPAGD